jgi:predicted nuclease of predicted toxin-antitoxin system
MFDSAVLNRLRELDYDVLAVVEIGMSTADDSEIVQWAIEHIRTVVTLDEHFGDWSVLPLSTHSGVIRLKVNPTTSANTLGLLLPFLTNHSDSRTSIITVLRSEAPGTAAGFHSIKDTNVILMLYASEVFENCWGHK